MLKPLVFIRNDSHPDCAESGLGGIQTVRNPYCVESVDISQSQVVSEGQRPSVSWCRQLFTKGCSAQISEGKHRK